MDYDLKPGFPPRRRRPGEFAGHTKQTTSTRTVVKMDFNRSRPEQVIQTVDLREEHLPRPLASVWGAFLYEGLMTSTRNPDRREHVLLLWKDSRARLISQSCRYLDRIWAHSRDRLQEVAWPEEPFEEAVVAQFGELVGYHLILNKGELPDNDEADAVIHHLLERYFETQTRTKEGTDSP